MYSDHTPATWTVSCNATRTATTGNYQASHADSFRQGYAGGPDRLRTASELSLLTCYLDPADGPASGTQRQKQTREPRPDRRDHPGACQHRRCGTGQSQRDRPSTADKDPAVRTLLLGPGVRPVDAGRDQLSAAEKRIHTQWRVPRKRFTKSFGVCFTVLQ